MTKEEAKAIVRKNAPPIVLAILEGRLNEYLERIHKEIEKEKK